MIREIERKISKNNILFRLIVEEIEGMMFYTIQKAWNDWERDDTILWDNYNDDSTYNPDKAATMAIFNEIE